MICIVLKDKHIIFGWDCYLYNGNNKGRDKKKKVAGIFVTILSIVGGAHANIVSTNFMNNKLADALEDYATKTELALKGDAADLTALSDKIGTLPTGYSTVGDALTAMNAKIDAKDLPSNSDDGQYVLSAKKVGGTITYTWVKMDLTKSEQQAQ